MDIFSTRYLRVNKLLLSFIGLWPEQSSSNKDTIFCCTILGILIVCLPQITYLFKHGKTLDDFYNILPTLTGAFLCLMKSVGLRCMIKKLTMLVQHMNYDWCLLANHKDVRILIEYIERSRMFTLAYLIFIIVGATSYVTAPLTVPILDFILASNVTRPKRLPHPSEFFIDLEKYYYILFAISSVGYIMCIMTVSAIDTMYFALLQYTCGMLTILSHRLENLSLSNDKSNRVSKGDKHVSNTIQCVQLHVRIERLIQLINSTFAISLMTDVGLGVLFQCSSCVMIVTRKDTAEIMKNGPLLLLQTSRIFFYSWIAQSIIDHSSELSTAAYNGMWYQSSLKAKKMLLFLIAKCRKPYRITLAKLYVISLEGYSMLMRTSVSYVMLMISLSPNDT
ncbi:odorant receptor 10-like [Linepithema humile]|uniref:odorant receptor 10-like n=1 Tax=Linepithema humile TaxID=83485 RepID=UPI00351EB950